MDTALPATHPAAAQEAKTKNIVEMGLGFSVMTRVFSEGAKAIIVRELEHFFAGMTAISEKQDYDRAHADFCSWFTKNIRTAERNLKNGRIKPSCACSYGQAAKVLDIAAKVYVYYCAQPSPEAAGQLIPMLNGAVDTPIMRHLTNRFPSAGIRSKTIEQIDPNEYDRMQCLVAKAISEYFDSQIHPVQYDDIMWRRLNRDKYVG